MNKVRQKSVLVTDNRETAAYLTTVLQFLGHELEIVPDINAFFTSQWEFGNDHCLAVFLDPACDEGERRALSRRLLDFTPHPPLFQLVESESAYASDLINEGVIDVLSLPTRFERLNALMRKAELFYESQNECAGVHRRVELFRSLSGNSRAAHKITRMIDHVAMAEAPVLILGEPGTGKEVVARKIHYQSRRHCKAFISVNCGSVTPDRLNRELFAEGPEDCAPTYLDQAEGGSLFLNGIDELNPEMQAKLLHLLRELGASRGKKGAAAHDVRILAGSHRCLDTAVKQGRFLEELYFRLNVFPIDVQPLRERTEDIPLLINDLVTRIEKEKRGAVRLTPAAVTSLTQYQWPGNVRELANLIEHLAYLYSYGLVDVDQLPERYRIGTSGDKAGNSPLRHGLVSDIRIPRLPPEDFDLKNYLGGIELNLIKEALQEAEGVVAHAARRLNMRRTTLVEKLKKYGLQRSQDVYEY
ncbi:MAG: sigma 54-interacting transcriptional regulator [Gammaproteobacteria bacterium]|nr:sigma 54-interacting transcriptional regulator [Gammaproteobacteria bacterium]MBU1654126.1 sigma 54-interacting transcriptional regulator [Gammaproteobacteria bacterium]MBU1960142.1 sigma 54-interacting transcriptional regulator [Gammaproteobacteria bacterium]